MNFENDSSCLCPPHKNYHHNENNPRPFWLKRLHQRRNYPHLLSNVKEKALLQDILAKKALIPIAHVLMLITVNWYRLYTITTTKCTIKNTVPTSRLHRQYCTSHISTEAYHIVEPIILYKLFIYYFIIYKINDNDTLVHHYHLHQIAHHSVWHKSFITSSIKFYHCR